MTRTGSGWFNLPIRLVAILLIVAIFILVLFHAHITNLMDQIPALIGP